MDKTTLYLNSDLTYEEDGWIAFSPRIKREQSVWRS